MMKQVIIQLKKSFFKKCHHQRANLENSDQNVEFIFGENNNYHQICNAYLQYEVTVENVEANQVVGILIDGDAIRLLKSSFA